MFKRRHTREVVLDPIYDVFELVDEFCIRAISIFPKTNRISGQRQLNG